MTKTKIKTRVERVDNCGTLLGPDRKPLRRQTTWAVYVDGQWEADVDTRRQARRLARECRGGAR
ncbi:MAG: hypothetical protein ACRCSL_16530 [Microbacterium sp.]